MAMFIVARLKVNIEFYKWPIARSILDNHIDVDNPICCIQPLARRNKESHLLGEEKR
jgi:hypothetical protein